MVTRYFQFHILLYIFLIFIKNNRLITLQLTTGIEAYLQKVLLREKKSVESKEKWIESKEKSIDSKEKSMKSKESLILSSNSIHPSPEELKKKSLAAMDINWLRPSETPGPKDQQASRRSWNKLRTTRVLLLVSRKFSSDYERDGRIFTSERPTRNSLPRRRNIPTTVWYRGWRTVINYLCAARRNDRDACRGF